MQLFDRWCASQEINGEYVKLHEQLLIEEFKSCLPTDVKTYLDENKAESLHRAATLVDDYSLTHQKIFSTLGMCTVMNTNASAAVSRYNLRSNARGQNDPAEVQRKNYGAQAAPTYHYCKRKGHVMSECWGLEKKEKNKLRLH